MASKKTFQTEAYRELNDAVYETLRTWVKIKKALKSPESFSQVKKKLVAQGYVTEMEGAIRKLLLHGTEWLCEVNSDSTP